MAWIYHRNYVGPDRRGDKFQVRFVERRRENPDGSRATVQNALSQVMAEGLRWVDSLKYFGPDRRGKDFSFFFLERRRRNNAAPPPPLKTALRQLRVRVMDAADATSRHQLRERVMATAMLADAQGQARVGDMLMELAHHLDVANDGADPRPALHARLIDAEAMLGIAA